MFQLGKTVVLPIGLDLICVCHDSTVFTVLHICFVTLSEDAITSTGEKKKMEVEIHSFNEGEIQIYQ